jgi:hypothetical protein
MFLINTELLLQFYCLEFAILRQWQVYCMRVVTTTIPLLVIFRIESPFLVCNQMMLLKDI